MVGPTALAVLLALAACTEENDASPPDVLAIAGEVVDVKGRVLLAADPGRRDEAVPVKSGDKVAGADVVVTESDGSVAIRLDHNGAIWNLGPDRQSRVSESAAWTAPRAKGDEVAFGKVERDRTAAAGRHAERQAANTAATALPGATDEAPSTAEAALESNAQLDRPSARAAAESKSLDESRNFEKSDPAAAAESPESGMDLEATPEPREYRRAASKKSASKKSASKKAVDGPLADLDDEGEDDFDGDDFEDDEDEGEGDDDDDDESRAVQAPRAAAKPEPAPRDVASRTGKQQNAGGFSDAKPRNARNAMPLSLGTTKLVPSTRKTRSAPPSTDVLRRTLERRLRGIATCIGDSGPKGRSVLTIDVQVSASGTISKLRPVSGPTSLKRCAAKELRKSIGTDVGRGPYRATQTIVWSGQKK